MAAAAGPRLHTWRRSLRTAIAALLLWPAWLLAGEPTILIFGDSLATAHGFDRDRAWPVLLEARLAEADLPHRIVNASRSGETTDGGARRLPEALARYEPTITLLELGGNDALRGQSPARVRDNLAQMITQARQAGSRVLLLGIRIPPNYGQAYTERFEAIYPDLAEAYDAPLVPFLLEDVWDEAGMMQEDGIHPTAAAQPVIAETVWQELRRLLDR